MNTIVHERASKMRYRSGLLNRHWYAACRSQDLKKSKPLAQVLFEESIVLWRDQSGRARAMLDRCLHRNAPLSEGVIYDGMLCCPYHGWSYDEHGVCVHVPSMGPCSKAPEGLQLETFHVREQDGLVWVWMGLEEPDEDPFHKLKKSFSLRSLYQDLPQIRDGNVADGHRDIRL